MASQPQTARKVLRIGLIQAGKLVQERVIKYGESVTVGDSTKNTFVVSDSGLPEPEFPLFLVEGDKTLLQFTHNMKGKINIVDDLPTRESQLGVMNFEQLREQPGARRQGQVWQIQLGHHDRGKLAVAGHTFLFQFVPEPEPQVATPLDIMDFRPAIVEEGDPIFFGFLVMWTAVGALFALIVWLAPPPAELTFADVEERFVEAVVPEEPPEPEPEKPQENTEAKGGKKKAEEKKAGGDKKPKSKEDRARQREARKQALRSKIRVARIGTRGRSSGGTTSDFYEAGVLSDIDSISGADLVEDGGPKGPRKGDSSNEDVRIGGLEVEAAGSTEGSAGPAVDFSNYAVSAGSGQVDEVEGADSVQSLVGRKSVQLQYCYEEQLRADPGLGGRVEVYWNIVEGRVTAVDVVGNTTGNDQLAQCIAKKIKRWRFKPDVNGPVTWPFVFRKK